MKSYSSSLKIIGICRKKENKNKKNDSGRYNNNDEVNNKYHKNATTRQDLVYASCNYMYVWRLHSYPYELKLKEVIFRK